MDRLKSVFARRFPLPSEWMGEKFEYEAAGESAQVYKIPDNWMVAQAKTTLSNRIWLNENLLHDFSDEAVEYVFLHELGHANRNVGERLEFTLTATGSLVVSLILFFLTAKMASRAIEGLILERIVVILITSAMAIGIAWVHFRIRRNEELRADLYALNKLGQEEFLKRRRKLEQAVDRGVNARVQRRLVYPDEDAILAAYKEISVNKKD